VAANYQTHQQALDTPPAAPVAHAASVAKPAPAVGLAG
jgi:hypothetical protein